jgi:ornithine carbamoyltransferase
MKRDLLSIADISQDEVKAIFALATTLKRAQKSRRPHRRLAGRSLAMIFEKPSLRTRVTFETGIQQLGGIAVNLAPGDIKLGERETVPDIARNLSRWVDLIVARTFRHQTVLDLAAAATVPVMNGLSDLEHPCQALADFFTLAEKRRRLQGLVFTFIGDGNNMVHSLMLAAVKLGVEFRLACPEGYEPVAEVVAKARREKGARLVLTHSVAEAARGADVLYTDVWTSMGQEEERDRRVRDLEAYRIDDGLVALASERAIVLHCLPAHYGEEITEEVLYGPRSAVWDQAENRLHSQKALLASVIR